MRYKPKILVVESDGATLRLFDATLKAIGAAPRCVASGRQASEVINREKFDGVFLDWDTPEVGGAELTKRVRLSKSNSRVPIAMLTSRRDTHAIAQGFEAGVTFFLQKPVGAKELTRLLNASRGAMLEERRRYQRVNVEMTILCDWDKKQLKGQGVNLSSMGVLATMSPRPGVGAEVKVEFTLPNTRQTVALKATVVRHGPSGQLAFKFHRPSAAESESIKEFVEKALSGGG